MKHSVSAGLFQQFLADSLCVWVSGLKTKSPTVKELRAFVVQKDEAGADYHRQPIFFFALLLCAGKVDLID